MEEGDGIDLRLYKRKISKFPKKTPNFLRYERYYVFLEFYALGDNFIQAFLVSLEVLHFYLKQEGVMGST